MPKPGERAESTLTYDQRRSRRRRAIRARTVNLRASSRVELAIGRALYPEGEDAMPRPKTRGECARGVRPCPFVSCQHHLYLDVSAKNGSMKLNFPDLEPDELEESCALDVADRGGVSLETVAVTMNLTRERIRQIEIKSIAKARATLDMLELRSIDAEEPERMPPRRLPLLAEPAFDADQFALADEPSE